MSIENSFANVQPPSQESQESEKEMPTPEDIAWLASEHHEEVDKNNPETVIRAYRAIDARTDDDPFGTAPPFLEKRLKNLMASQDETGEKKESQPMPTAEDVSWLASEHHEDVDSARPETIIRAFRAIDARTDDNPFGTAPKDLEKRAQNLIDQYNK